MSIGIPCNACVNGWCGNCVAEKLEVAGFIESATFHCSCVNNGHPNRKTKDNLNKAIFSKQKDIEPAHLREIQSDTDDEFEDE